ncbi:MAG: hypothetical protein Kow00121_12400 [Elainellaceae cyanobacterium]
MNETDRQRVQKFIETWKGSQGNERANYQGFFLDLCDVLGVDRPPPKGNIAGDPYCFDKNIQVIHKDGFSTNYADFYKEGCFLIEAKQGGNSSKRGTAKRGTKTYDTAMEKAFYQALSYTPFLPSKPPFVITCDIGSHFELWMSFSGNYGGYGARETIALDKLIDEKVFDRFVAIFSDPQSLNPEKYRAKVTREVADTLAKLARWLEEQGNEPQEVANFLMRCIFTMFAEDVDLLKGEVFTKALKDRWIGYPPAFKSEIETLWQMMNTGGNFGFERIMQFNGSFFADATAFDLPKAQLEVLYEAAEKDWSAVEPAIFGTLLERALDKKERSRLGAHYTPRSYVERLVRPVVMEPLREEWLLVESEVDRLLTLKDNQQEPTKTQRQKAAKEIQAFLDKLQQIRILDPACGTGNFLYVTLDLLKTLEQEVQTRLLDVVGQVTTDLLEEFDPRLAGRKQVNPSQFLGIEINPRAAAIAELVIWIGYLQWHFKRYGSTPPPEPILQDFHNIEFRDAVLAYDGKEPDIDPKTGKVRTRWGGRMMKHPVTGEDVPDPSDQIPIYRYINARSAEWQEADYIVSNPPFIGKINMRESLGDGYAESLREVYDDIPDAADFVMYWWNKAAHLVQQNQVYRFGFISTNSLKQTYNRRVIQAHLTKKKPISIFYAIPDHPWIDSANGAAIRIAMTAGGLTEGSGTLAEVTFELKDEDGEHVVSFKQRHGTITPSLTLDLDPASCPLLRSNYGMSCVGYQLTGRGFVVNEEVASQIDPDYGTEKSTIWSLLSGRSITQTPSNLFAIDLFGWTLEKVQKDKPLVFQWLLERVKPEREQNNNPALRKTWWLFEKGRATFRPALKGLSRAIVTSLTSKHRFFVFVAARTICDSTTVMLALDDAYFLGILSSKIHVIWALASGGTLEDRPRYNKTVCFDPFPFPDPTPEQKQKIRELGEQLDAHRKRVQVQHPDVTITGMYNLLEKLRKGEAFTESDRAYNDKALVSTLKQIHDELDAAVLEAYGWEDLIPLLSFSLPKQETVSTKRIFDLARPLPIALETQLQKLNSLQAREGIDVFHELIERGIEGKTLFEEIILKRLVALNAERAEEERNGLIRWLRPEYQAPDEVKTQQQVLTGVVEPEETVIAPVEQKPFPKQPKEQLAAIRDLLRTSGGEWSIEQIAAQFKNGGRYKGAISENLERLEWFGVLMVREEGQIKRWQYAEMQQSA